MVCFYSEPEIYFYISGTARPQELDDSCRCFKLTVPLLRLSQFKMMAMMRSPGSRASQTTLQSTRTTSMPAPAVPAVPAVPTLSAPLKRALHHHAAIIGRTMTNRDSTASERTMSLAQTTLPASTLGLTTSADRESFDMRISGLDSHGAPFRLEVRRGKVVPQLDKGYAV